MQRRLGFTSPFDDFILMIWMITDQSGCGVLQSCQKGVFRLVGLTKRSEPSKKTFQLVGLTKRTDWSGTDQSGRWVLSGCQKGAFRLVGRTKRFDWSGTDQSGCGIFLAAIKKEPSDWSGERSVLICPTPTNQDAKFIATVKRSLSFRASPRERGPSS
jgi:hypothetical protein